MRSWPSSGVALRASCFCLIFFTPSDSGTDACSSQPMSGHAVSMCNKFRLSSTTTCPRKSSSCGTQLFIVLVLIKCEGTVKITFTVSVVQAVSGGRVLPSMCVRFIRALHMLWVLTP